MVPTKTIHRLMTHWLVICLIVSLSASPTLAVPDAWDTSQKNLITNCEDWNRWLDLLVPALTRYRDSLTPHVGKGQQIQNQIDAVNKFLEAAEGFKCYQDNQLLDKKRDADLLLNPINLVRALSKLWVAGTELYGLTIQLILKSLAGEPEVVPFKLINAVLDFLIEGAQAAGDNNAAKKLREVKHLKDAVEKGKDILENLRKAVEALSKT